MIKPQWFMIIKVLNLLIIIKNSHIFKIILFYLIKRIDLGHKYYSDGRGAQKPCNILFFTYVISILVEMKKSNLKNFLTNPPKKGHGGTTIGHLFEVLKY